MPRSKAAEAQLLIKRRLVKAVIDLPQLPSGSWRALEYGVKRVARSLFNACTDQERQDPSLPSWFTKEQANLCFREHQAICRPNQPGAPVCASSGAAASSASPAVRLSGKRLRDRAVDVFIRIQGVELTEAARKEKAKHPKKYKGKQVYMIKKAIGGIRFKNLAADEKEFYKDLVHAALLPGGLFLGRAGAGA